MPPVASPFAIIAQPTIFLPQDTPVTPASAFNEDKYKKNEQFKTFMLQKLNEIKEHGHVVKQYKISGPRRFWNVLSTALCCTTVCSPCLAWDCACCCLSAVCCNNNPFKWGLTFQTIAKTCDDTFEDERENTLDTYKSRIITNDTIVEVGKTFLQEFDAQIQTQTVQGAKKANIIRYELVCIIRRFGPFKYFALQDDGNIETLKKIINVEIPTLINI
jgi:hypothetical protein